VPERDVRHRAGRLLRGRAAQAPERRERELRLGERKRRCLEREPAVPANRSALVPAGVGAQEQRQRERVREGKVPELAGGDLGRADIACRDGPGEPPVSRPLRGHERMFAGRPRR
jgi:hypothetical protein